MLTEGFTYDMAWYFLQSVFWVVLFLHAAIKTRCLNAAIMFVSVFIGLWLWMAERRYSGHPQGYVVTAPPLSDIEAYSAYYNSLYFEAMICVMVAVFAGSLIMFLSGK